MSDKRKMRKFGRILLQRMTVMFLGTVVFLLCLEAGLRIVGMLSAASTHNGLPAPAGSSYTILCLGDSFTYGIGASRGKDYPSQLEGILNTRAGKGRFKVVNAGVCANNTSQILEQLKAILKAGSKPDLVVLWAGGANYWNYWGYQRYLQSDNFVSRLNDWLYRVRIYKLGKLLLRDVAEKARRRGRGGNEQHSSGRFGLVSTCFALETPESGNKGNVNGRSNRKECGSKQDFEKRGWVYQDSGQYEKAMQCFMQGLKGENKTGCYFGLGWACKELKRYQEAIQWFEKGREAAPQEASVYAGIGWSFAGLGKVEDAMRWFHEGIVLFPGDARCFEGIGWQCMAERKYEEAASWFAKGLKRSCDSGCYIGLGWAYRELKRFDEAVKWLTEGIANTPETASVYEGLGWVYRELKRYGEAISCFEKGLKINPHKLGCFLGMGWVYKDLKRYDEAVEWLKKGLAEDMRDPSVLEALGAAYGELKLINDGVKCLKDGIRFNPEDDRCYAALGWLYVRSGHPDKAVEYAMKAIRLNPKVEGNFNLLTLSCVSSDGYGRLALCLNELRKEVPIPEGYADIYMRLGSAGKKEKIGMATQDWITSDIGRIITMCEENNIKIILQDYPLKEGVSRIICRIAGERGIPIVHNYEKFRVLTDDGKDCGEYFVPDDHCNDKGYRIVAEGVSDLIVKIVLGLR